MLKNNRELLRKQADRNRLYRIAFFSTVDNYNQIRATIGQAPALNYSVATQGKAKYKNDVSFTKVIDFSADVHNAVKATLTSAELNWFKLKYEDKPNQSSSSTEEELRLQEKLGQVFISRKIHPITVYFEGTRAA